MSSNMASNYVAPLHPDTAFTGPPEGFLMMPYCSYRRQDLGQHYPVKFHSTTIASSHPDYDSVQELLALSKALRLVYPFFEAPHPEHLVGRMHMLAVYGPSIPQHVMAQGVDVSLKYVLQRVKFAAHGSPDNHEDPNFCEPGYYWCEPYWPGAPFPILMQSAYGWNLFSTNYIQMENSIRSNVHKPLNGKKPFVSLLPKNRDIEVPAGHRFLQPLFRLWDLKSERSKWGCSLIYRTGGHNTPGERLDCLPGFTQEIMRRIWKCQPPMSLHEVDIERPVAISPAVANGSTAKFSDTSSENEPSSPSVSASASATGVPSQASDTTASTHQSPELSNVAAQNPSVVTTTEVPWLGWPSNRNLLREVMAPNLYVPAPIIPGMNILEMTDAAVKQAFDASYTREYNRFMIYWSRGEVWRATESRNLMRHNLPRPSSSRPRRNRNRNK